MAIKEYIQNKLFERVKKHGVKGLKVGDSYSNSFCNSYYIKFNGIIFCIEIDYEGNIDIY